MLPRQCLSAVGKYTALTNRWEGNDRQPWFQWISFKLSLVPFHFDSSATGGIHRSFSISLPVGLKLEKLFSLSNNQLSLMNSLAQRFNCSSSPNHQTNRTVRRLRRHLQLYHQQQNCGLYRSCWFSTCHLFLRQISWLWYKHENTVVQESRNNQLCICYSVIFCYFVFGWRLFLFLNESMCTSSSNLWFSIAHKLHALLVHCQIQINSK